jgi:undecaprenyl-diphosphatase
VASLVPAPDWDAPSARIGNRLRAWPPPVVVATVALAGAVILIALLVGIGWFLTSSPLADGIRTWDAGVSRWAEASRTPLWNGWTEIGSNLARTEAIMLVAGLSVLILAVRRLWYEAGFLATALAIELTVFLTSTMIIDRPRPTIEPLDPLPFTSSFPSGHVGAAIVMYVGLALIVSAHTRLTAIRLAVWVVGIALPVWVGVSRVYRGMHHATDVAASIVLGSGALLLALIASRSAAAAAERRRASAITAPSVPEPTGIRA